MTAYFNENSAFPAAWLENLTAAGHIAKGEIDDRDIRQVTPDDLRGFDQCHFFAGIGVWSYALRLAGVPDDARVWTGSCPCQPWSGVSRGRAKGKADPRHLWPAWFKLIRECRPPVVFGEQVSGGDGLLWLDTVPSDLECECYACRAFDRDAAGWGLPPRKRLFFVAYPDSEGQRMRPEHEQMARISKAAELAQENRVDPGALDDSGDGDSVRMARLRAYGNAIVPQVAAAFIRASLAEEGLNYG